MRLAFVSNHPAPYRDPFLGRLVSRGDIDVDVFSLFAEDTAHHFWDLESPPYPNEILVTEPRPPKWKTLVKLLRMFVFGKYDCVCWPGFLLNYLVMCMVVQALLGKKYIITADTVQQRPLEKLSFRVKRFLVRHAHFIFVPGKASSDYFIKTFSIPMERICIGAYALDSNALSEKVFRLRKRKDEIRKEYGLESRDRVFLMVANMIRTRHYPVTAAAFLSVAEKHPNTKFIMVGEGPDLEKMQSLALEHSVLKVIPGVSFGKMMELYAIADVYVHGGTEPASTALVIGAIAGLPLLSSMAVGCSWDCLQDGRSGCCVTDYLSANEWEVGFERMLGNESSWPEWGRRARELSQTLDVEPAVKRFCSMIRG